MEFEQIREEILELIKNSNVYSLDDFKKIQQITSRVELIQAIKNNIDWLVEAKVINADNLKKWFSERELRKYYICAYGSKTVTTSIDITVLILGDGQFSVNALMDCTVKIKAYNQSKAIVKTNKVSKVILNAKDNSSATIIMHKDSQAEVIMNNESSLEIGMINNTAAKIEANDSSKVIALMRNDSKTAAKIFGDSQVTIKTYDNASVENLN